MLRSLWREFRGSVSADRITDEMNRKSVLTQDDSDSDSPPELRSRTSRFKYGEIEGMDVIEKSPYEPNKSAEADEPLFEKLKMLLLSNEELHGEAQDMDGVPTLTIQSATIQLFGENLAESFVKASYIIGRSGMLFSPTWIDHKECRIRNVKCGWIPKNMMLLLLQHQRFGRANDVGLQSVMNSLGVMSIFFDALEDWDLDEPVLLHNAPSIHFSAKKGLCLKCIIFIARAYRCCKVFRQNNANDDLHSLEADYPSLYVKVQQCLKILTDNVKVNEKRLQIYLAGKEAEAEKRATKEYFGVIQNKRRRSNASEEESAIRVSMKSVESSVSSTSSPIIIAMATAGSRSTPGPDTSLPHTAETSRGASPLSTDELLERASSKFRQLGRVIKKLKHQVNQDRQQLKDELRQEILEELKRSSSGGSISPSSRTIAGLREKK